MERTAILATMGELKLYGMRAAFDAIITAAGVSSGIDMALRLVELLFDRVSAQAAQLLIEYDPQPPFHSGALANADEATLARALEFLRSRK